METVNGPDSPERMLEHMVDLYQLPLLRLCYAYCKKSWENKMAGKGTCHNRGNMVYLPRASSPLERYMNNGETKCF